MEYQNNYVENRHTYSYHKSSVNNLFEYKNIRLKEAYYYWPKLVLNYTGQWEYLKDISE